MAFVGHTSMQAVQLPQWELVGESTGNGMSGIKLAQEKPGAFLLIDYVGVFADPALPGFLSQRFFHYRGAVAKCTIPRLPIIVDNFIRKGLQSLSHYFVVVTSKRIAGNVAGIWILKRSLSFTHGFIQIVNSHGDHPARFRQSTRRDGFVLLRVERDIPSVHGIA